jgi:hypothetical protein
MYRVGAWDSNLDFEKKGFVFFFHQKNITSEAARTDHRHRFALY